MHKCMDTCMDSPASTQQSKQQLTCVLECRFEAVRVCHITRYNLQPARSIATWSTHKAERHQGGEGVCTASCSLQLHVQ
jgi:hypothetical protein